MARADLEVNDEQIEAVLLACALVSLVVVVTLAVTSM